MRPSRRKTRCRAPNKSNTASETAVRALYINTPRNTGVPRVCTSPFSAAIAMQSPRGGAPTPSEQGTREWAPTMARALAHVLALFVYKRPSRPRVTVRPLTWMFPRTTTAPRLGPDHPSRPTCRLPDANMQQLARRLRPGPLSSSQLTSTVVSSMSDAPPASAPELLAAVAPSIKGSYRNYFRPLAMAESRPSACTSHGCL